MQTIFKSGQWLVGSSEEIKYPLSNQSRAVSTLLPIAHCQLRTANYSFSTRSMHMTAPRISCRTGWSGGMVGEISSM